MLWIYGPFIDPMSGADFVPLNTADNWRHFVLGVGMIGPGVIFGRNSNATALLRQAATVDLLLVGFQ